MAETRIIFTHGGGRLANQLISHAHLLAFCAQHPRRFSLCNIALWPWRAQLAYAPAVSNGTRPNTAAQICEILLKAIAGKHGHNTFLRLIYRMAGLWPNLARFRTPDIDKAFLVQATAVPPIDLASQEAVALLTREPTVLLCGWQIRSWALVHTHRALILQRTLPSAQIAESAERLVGKMRAKCDFLVGVHIRRGDYRIYRNGCFFYELQQYADWMRQLQQRYAGFGSVGFLICSDEIFGLQDFEGLNVMAAWEFEEALPFRDNVALSRCDVLMGPPSTFALWAAFSGTIPMLVLTDQSVDMLLEPALQDSFFSWLRHPLFTEFSP
jgi:hypothetical protein